MSSGSIVSIVLLVVAIAGFIISRRKIKKESPVKADELYETLRSLGIKASRVSEEVLSEVDGRKSRQQTAGLFQVKSKQIDFVKLTGEAQQYGVTYYLDFLVRKIPLPRVKKFRIPY